MGNNKPVMVIVGPTASGKSSYALQQAREKNGVIINADSMQLYNALPTLTAQPSAEDCEQVPHRLYAVMEPAEDSASAWRWREMALKEINSAHEKGRIPIITGGTGFYIKALTEGLSPIPETPQEIRQQVTAELTTTGHQKFYEELKKRDPVTAGRLHPHDSQRLIRAHEVLDHTGKMLSWWQDQPLIAPPPELSFEIQVLHPPRALLHQRCNDRFDQMVAEGVMEEVAALDSLIAEGVVAPDALITKALGFVPLRSYLKEEISLEEAMEKAKAQTRQYAKRQVTWFRNQIPDTVPRITPSQEG